MRLRPIAPPSAPQTFYGRDAELTRIIDMILDINSPPARIAILGPAGYGKTTLARAVLNNVRIRERYCDARYFVPCDSTSSAGTLLPELGKVLGMSESTPDILRFRIDATLAEKDSILCFDNFESAWDQPEDVKHSVEQFLSKITEFHRVTVLITMRGTERPAETKWTQPFLGPLRTLSYDAAENIWKEINGHYDTFTENLLKAVDCVPLAVNLLAHQGQVMPSKLLWEEWNKKNTKLIKRGQMHKLSDLEYSIQLSIDSQRMKACPSAKDLLGVLSMLPDGMHTEHLTKFMDILPNLDVVLCLKVLQQCGLVELKEDRYQAHSLICQFCINQSYISLKHKTALESFYLTLACSDSQKVSSQTYAEIRLEVNNTKSVLLSILKSSQTDYSRLIDAIITLTKFLISIGDFDTTLLDQATKQLQNNNGMMPLLIRCLQVWGELYYYADKMESSREKLLEAEMLCLSTLVDNRHLYGPILNLLGQICLSHHKLNEARDLYWKALHFHITTNNILGQGNDHEGLAWILLLEDRLNDAKASFKEALKFHKASDNNLGQGNDHLGLGEIYLSQNKLGDAKAHFQRALQFHEIAHNHLYQGCDYKGLGDIYLRQDKLQAAEASFQRALNLHKMVGATMDQGNDYRGLGDVYFNLNEIDKAESSYQNALKQYKDANNIPSQGNALNRLGHAYLMKSQLEEAKNMFEKALEIHEQVQAQGWKEEDKECLERISSMLSVSSYDQY
jgi:tetratricopeptide (TPR) repeat protein